MANAKPAREEVKAPAKETTTPAKNTNKKARNPKNKYEPGEKFVSSISSKKDKDGNPIVRQIKITNR